MPRGAGLVVPAPLFDARTIPRGISPPGFSALLSLRDLVVLQLERRVEVVFPDLQRYPTNRVLALEDGHLGTLDEIGRRESLVQELRQARLVDEQRDRLGDGLGRLEGARLEPVENHPEPEDVGVG